MCMCIRWFGRLRFVWWKRYNSIFNQYNHCDITVPILLMMQHDITKTVQWMNNTINMILCFKLMVCLWKGSVTTSLTGGLRVLTTSLSLSWLPGNLTLTTRLLEVTTPGPTHNLYIALPPSLWVTRWSVHMAGLYHQIATKIKIHPITELDEKEISDYPLNSKPWPVSSDCVCVF